MKAAVIYENGPPSVLQYEDIPDPVLRPGYVLIKVEAISLEGGDLINRSLAPPPSAPYVVGYQAAGTIVALGDGVTGFTVGDRVVGFNWSGSHAELFPAPAQFVFRLPDHADCIALAPVPVAFGTAAEALFARGGLQSGETVLILGGSGGVGLAAIQLAKAAQAVTIATTLDDASLAELAKLGLDHGINVTKADFVERVLELTDGKGVDLIVDFVGGPSIKPVIKSARTGGRISIVGAASGKFQTFGFEDIVPRSLTVHGIQFGRVMHLERVHRAVEGYLSDVAEGRLKMPIDRTYPLSSAVEAHTYAETVKPIGRIVLTV